MPSHISFIIKCMYSSLRYIYISLTVWCCIRSGAVFRACFSENAADSIFTIFDPFFFFFCLFLHEIRALNVDEFCFKQDSAACKTARETMNLLLD